MSDKEAAQAALPHEGISRRDLLKQAVVAAGFMIVPRFVLGGPGYTPPSEMITRGIIGCGGMGQQHLTYEYGPLLGLCDVDRERLDKTVQKVREKGSKDVTGYGDFREMLARPDIDVIHVVTPPHWHAAMSIMAAEAGKDVWCEKPMTRTIGEGLRVQEAIRRTGRMFRINTWFRYENTWYGSGVTSFRLKKLVDSGLLGWPLKFHLGEDTGFDWKFEWCGTPGLPEEPVPSVLNYDMWLGPAPYKPYNSQRVHMKFRGYWDYDGGGLGDMGQHYLDPAQYLLGKDDTSPIAVEAETVQQDSEAVMPFRKISLRYADGCEIIIDGSPKSGRRIPLIEGPKGKLYPKFESDIDDLERKLAAFPDPVPQVGQFVDSVKTRQKFALNEENGHRSCTLINLAKIAMQTGRPLKFDPDKFQFINDDQANQLLAEPMRAPWQIT